MNKIIEDDIKYIIDSSKIDWNRFADMTILITGANGMLASYIVETLMYLNKWILKDNPCSVVALVRNKNKASKRFSHIYNKPFFRIVSDDINSPLYIENKIDYILHTASFASPKYYNTSPVDVIIPNMLGTKNTLELAIDHNIKSYLFFSAGEIYNENDTLSVRSCYGESKRIGEMLCTSYHHQHNVPTKIARIFHTYGPGMNLNGGRVFEDFVKNVVDNKDIELKSDGSAIRQFCYIADATVAFFKILLDGENGQAYDVANTLQKVSIKELAKIVTNIYPEKMLKYSYIEKDKNYLQSNTKEYTPDISKLTDLGWTAGISIEEGFKRTIESVII